MIVLPVTPMGAVRQVRKDKWNPSPAVIRYRRYRDELRLLARRKRLQVPAEGSRIVFVLPMPPSWPDSQREMLNGMPHTQKPDVDNLHKGFMDALLKDDAHVWDARITKLWGPSGAIFVTDIDDDLKTIISIIQGAE